ncbi:MAG: hypothetical protein VW709_06040, partial [Rickettsiales bacterium]
MSIFFQSGNGTNDVGGISHLKWGMEGQYLYMASSSGAIACWDVRYNKEELGMFSIPGESRGKRRLRFDVDASDKYLAVGNYENNILVYDSQSFVLVNNYALALEK